MVIYQILINSYIQYRPQTNYKFHQFINGINNTPIYSTLQRNWPLGKNLLGTFVSRKCHPCLSHHKNTTHERGIYIKWHSRVGADYQLTIHVSFWRGTNLPSPLSHNSTSCKLEWKKYRLPSAWNYKIKINHIRFPPSWKTSTTNVPWQQYWLITNCKHT